MKKFRKVTNEVTSLLLWGGMTLAAACISYFSLEQVSLPRQDRVFGILFLAAAVKFAFIGGANFEQLRMGSFLFGPRLRFKVSPCRRLAWFQLGNESYVFARRMNLAGRDHVITGLIYNVKTREQLQIEENWEIIHPVVEFIRWNCPSDLKLLQPNETVPSILEQMQNPKSIEQLVS